jgi:hypothetical protein
LYRAQWEKNPALYAKAIEELSAVNAAGFTLTPNYKDNFDISKENNSESVFEVQITRGDFNTWLATDFGLDGDQNVGFAATARPVIFLPNCGPTGVCAPTSSGQGYGTAHVSQPLQNEFEPNDPRRPETLFQQGDDFFGKTFDARWSVTGSTPAKYVKQESLAEFPPNFSTNNERLIRLADVKLMLAEARLLGNNDVAGAAALINEVRHRADPTDLILPPRPATAGQPQMFAWLRHERRVELAFEGHRYNDLVRWHRAGLINIKTDVDFGNPTANANWSERNLVKPIPQRDLDLNANLRQNPQY